MSARDEAPAPVIVPAGGALLDGDLGVPPGAQGVVVFAHGSGSGRHSPRNRYVASVLRRAGLATLLMDLLTPDEERADAGTRHLRFDVGMLSERLVSAVEGGGAVRSRVSLERAGGDAPATYPTGM